MSDWAADRQEGQKRLQVHKQDGCRRRLGGGSEPTNFEEEPHLVHDIHEFLSWGLRETLIGTHLPRILRQVWLRSEQNGPPARMSVTRFSRQDVVRILHLDARELAAWERAGLVTVHSEYSFSELGELRVLRDLRARRISARSIRKALDAMHRMAGMRNPLRESSAASGGARLWFRHEGALVDPLTQQLAFDFELTGHLERRVEVVTPPFGAGGQRSLQVQELFLKAVRLEETADTLPEAVLLYETVLELRPQHAPSLINLGTIFYNQKEFTKAERLYRRAAEADPKYALAFFDLGNVLDELGRLPEATAAYSRAVSLVPHYADAHYNLALAHERQGQRRRALRHWLTYVRLDPVGPWSAHARAQARRTLNAEKLSIVSRRGRLVQAG